MCNELGHFWNDLGEPYKYGILWKKESYKKLIEEIESSESVYCIRTRFTSITKRWDFSQENVDLVMAVKL
jgi:hypothetical protein